MTRVARRRLRPTFLLKCVLTVVVFGLAIASLLLLNPIFRTAGAVPLSRDVLLVLLAGAVALWFVLVDFGAAFLGGIVARWAENRPGRSVDRWFVDRDVERSAARVQQEHEVRDNSAIW